MRVRACVFVMGSVWVEKCDVGGVVDCRLYNVLLDTLPRVMYNSDVSEGPSTLLRRCSESRDWACSKLLVTAQ